MIYLDTSALLKSIFVETHSDALQAYVREHDAEGFVSSVLLSIETRRAVQRIDPHSLPQADLELSRVGQVALADAVVEAAGRFPDPRLRSRDAIHLATALLLREELTALVSYDTQMLAAAESQRLPAVSPGDAG